MTLDPVVVLVDSESLAYLRSLIADIPPIAEGSGLKQRNGWTDEMILLGRVLSTVAELHRSGYTEVFAQ